MVIISLILLQVFVFAGFIFFLRHLLTRNVTNATSRLQGMMKDYSSKQEEIQKKIEDAEQQYQEILKKAAREAEELKERYKKEMDEERNHLLEQAHKQSEELLNRANKTCETIRSELERNITEQAVERAGELICRVLPEDACRIIHSIWLTSLISQGISGLDRLRIPEDVQQAEVFTPFALTPEEKKELADNLKGKLGREIEIVEHLQPELVAGIIVNLSNLVFDGSFALKIREAGREIR